MKDLHHDTLSSLDDRIQYGLLVVLRASIVAGGALAAYYHEFGAILYSILALILTFLPKLIKHHVKVNLPIEFDVVLVVFMYVAVFLGKVGQAYERFWWWDAVLHTASGFILGFIGFLILYIKIQQKQLQASRFLVGLIIFSLAVAMGVVWEIFEFFIDVAFGGNLQRGSLHDTMWDLVVDSIGALLMAWVGVRQIFDKPRGFVARWTENFVKINPMFARGHHDK